MSKPKGGGDMKKKLGIVIVLFLILSVGMIGFLFVTGTGYVKGRLMKNENSYMIVNDKDAMYFSVTKGMEKRLEKMSTGDEIMIVHGLVLTSFPSSTDAKALIKLSDGDESDLPVETIAQFTAYDLSQEREIVTSSHEDDFIKLVIPEGWEYEVKEFKEEGYQEFGIYFWPEGQTEGKLALMCAGESWGVCGTGLTTKEVRLGNYRAVKYIYHSDQFWTFLRFDYPETNYVVYNEGADRWLKEYGVEAFTILSSVEFPE